MRDTSSIAFIIVHLWIYSMARPRRPLKRGPSPGWGSTHHSPSKDLRGSAHLLFADEAGARPMSAISCKAISRSAPSSEFSAPAFSGALAKSEGGVLEDESCAGESTRVPCGVSSHFPVMLIPCLGGSRAASEGQRARATPHRRPPTHLPPAHVPPLLPLCLSSPPITQVHGSFFMAVHLDPKPGSQV